MALTLHAPADALGPLDVSVTSDAGESAGTVALLEGDSVLSQAPMVDGRALFSGLVLPSGPHTLTALLTGSLDTTWTSSPVEVYTWGAPGVPEWASPTKRTVASPVPVRVRAGASTATMTVLLNGNVVRSVACTPGQAVDLGTVKLGKGASTVTVEAVSLSGETTTAVRTVMRKEWPYSTCIVIDKSQFKLYWVKNQQLVKTYKVAHGRYNWTPECTWKVLAKYRTYPRGVYGPRKMRLFRRIGAKGHYRYVFTRYAIHGTNQPWVIGTMASHGCIRMYNRDILELWPRVPIGTYVVTTK